ncbi:pentapeptide repeat-containing protein [uncultured Roseobacter sp.]|uniref:pentapeptide repeat-containing protein n=1 Tax=uncultured Roseobacter sp. TaxID=114847 RepID=UPI002621B2D5|nr:pentapeptide repeat-containing protein [uncultured Roseobacter sp.]
MTDDTRLSRVQALTANARNTWFILLAVLIFVGVTMLGVRPIDFYGVSRDTELPLVGVSVPTRLFFYTAPILTVAVYGYFHLYLVRLWDALGELPESIKDRRLGDAVTPWLITDTALTLRRHLRKDGCCQPRALEFPSVFWNIVFAWLAGPVVLLYVWFQSLPARDLALTGVAAAMFVFSLIFGLGSAMMIFYRMRGGAGDPAHQVKKAGFLSALIGTLAALPIGALSWLVTERPGHYLARLDLTAENIVERPAGWLPYEIARNEFLVVWCKREEETPCTLIGLDEPQRKAFNNEWWARHRTLLADMNRPLWEREGADRPNFNNAILRLVFLAGANMRGEDYLLRGTILTRAQLEGANLRKVTMKDVVLRGVRMARANMTRSTLEDVDLQGALLDDAIFRNAEMVRVQLRGAFMNGTDLNGSVNNGGLLRNIDLTAVVFDKRTDFRNVFLDGTVQLPEGFQNQMGHPCQWVDQDLDDEAFFGRWRGWIEAAPPEYAPPAWEQIAPDDYKDTSAIPPPPGCTWKTGPLPQ